MAVLSLTLLGCQSSEVEKVVEETPINTLEVLERQERRMLDESSQGSIALASPEEVPEMPVLLPTQPASGTGSGVSAALTFYVCSGAPSGYQDGYCGTMASGRRVYEGAAACGYGFLLGTRFQIEGDPTGRVYVCEDRGLGSYLWVDVFFWDYSMGRSWRNNFPGYINILVLD